jgi:signal peptidase II
LRKGILAASVSSSVVLIDIVTKKIIETYIQPYDVIPVLPFLSLVNVKNTGAAFGILSNLNNNIFIIVSLIAIFFICLYMVKTTKSFELISLSLILGGAVGNLIDRVKIGKVIDFIDFFVGQWHWPAFNVADSALTIGIILFLLTSLKEWKHHDKKN